MGLYDRDYLRTPAGPRGGPTGRAVNAMRLWSVSTWLIAINVAVFLIDLMLRTPEGLGLPFLWGHFSAYTALYQGQVWRFITFQFLHAGPQHIFFNMLSLYFFGGMIENYLGPRRFLAFYLLCGIAGALAYLLLWRLGILVNHPATPMVGASAGIFGVLMAAAQIAPNTRVMLMFPPIPMPLKVLAWIMIAIALVTILSSGRNAGGEAAHLGGAALGAVLIGFPGALNVFDFFANRRRAQRGFPADPWRR